jgi:formylglycine-generating enzyme required for sulfatase activity
MDLDDIDSQIEQVGGRYQPRSGYEAHPVTMVSWDGAQAYCQWAGARLPTEAEWEYAVRGSESRVFPWGNEFRDANLNYRSSSDGYTETAPVGSFVNGASWAGALDMAGNVAEWTADWFRAYQPDSQNNPKGPDEGQYRVNRGGSFLSEPFEVRGASRSAGNPSDANRALGFRCAVA